MLRKAGFSEVEVLHKNSCFAAFGAIKRSVNKAYNPGRSQ
jgi:hypothetical protein